MHPERILENCPLKQASLVPEVTDLRTEGLRTSTTKDNDDSSDDDSDGGGEDNTRRREGIYNDDDDDSLSGLPDPSKSTCCSLKMAEKPPAGSFIHEVPLSDDSSSSNEKEGDDENKDIVPDFDESISQLIRKRREPPLASRPSTIDGVPTEKAGTGF
ncbi:hypothetical protein FRACYDRAFT_252984 [Fragilariopsis cylindrus CCMP1102]|uniref:Uncharacterized protein n=1 Tax=Fragilariopsis cylindrus CCMP1102 TaxID=635003 RepID=A0A1E7ELK4_9STRA|nr:hypothetical protein FRACYDRAFT_252984 [Fragilariopsis cylindrus CCMP1102]|eukprot:OEU06800.1 hypothetical protein FRACYDRAFT_252984 [Fragilariopsis cylindrus CCMP1102]